MLNQNRQKWHPLARFTLFCLAVPCHLLRALEGPMNRCVASERMNVRASASAQQKRALLSTSCHTSLNGSNLKLGWHQPFHCQGLPLQTGVAWSGQGCSFILNFSWQNLLWKLSCNLGRQRHVISLTFRQSSEILDHLQAPFHWIPTFNLDSIDSSDTEIFEEGIFLDEHEGSVCESKVLSHEPRSEEREICSYKMLRKFLKKEVESLDPAALDVFVENHRLRQHQLFLGQLQAWADLAMFKTFSVTQEYLSEVEDQVQLSQLIWKPELIEALRNRCNEFSVDPHAFEKELHGHLTSILQESVDEKEAVLFKNFPTPLSTFWIFLNLPVEISGKSFAQLCSKSFFETLKEKDGCWHETLLATLQRPDFLSKKFNCDHALKFQHRLSIEIYDQILKRFTEVSPAFFYQKLKYQIETLRPQIQKLQKKVSCVSEMLEDQGNGHRAKDFKAMNFEFHLPALQNEVIKPDDLPSREDVFVLTPPSKNLRFTLEDEDHSGVIYDSGMSFFGA